MSEPGTGEIGMMSEGSGCELNMAARLKRFFALLLVLFVLLQPSASPSSTARKQTQGRTLVDLLVTGGTVVTMDGERRLIVDGAIAISNNKIVAAGSRPQLASKFEGRAGVDAHGKVIIPGLINGHTHVPMTLFRGLGDDLDLNEWLTKYIFPAEAKNVTEKFVRTGTQLGLAEMIRSGTTTYCDMYYFEDAVAEETARAGMRGLLGETVIDFPVPDNRTFADALRYTKGFVERWRGHPLITPAIAPHAPYTVSEEHLKQWRALADQTGAPLVIHVAETRKEVEDTQTAKGATPVEYLARIGFLDNRVIAAHVVHVSLEELRLLKRYGVGLVHNPQSNMKLASGIARVPEMLSLDMNLGLGTDGAASNNDLHLWEEIDTAAKLHKISTLNPRVVSAREAFEMATIRGARALHMEGRIGSIEAGKQADLVILDFDALHQTPSSADVYSHLVYATKAADVRTVIIDGRIVMRDRRLLTLDEERIKREARALREKIAKSLAAAAAK